MLKSRFLSRRQNKLKRGAIGWNDYMVCIDEQHYTSWKNKKGRARDRAIGRVGPRRLWGHSSHCSRISLHIHVPKALLLNGHHHKWHNDKHRHQLLAMVCIKGKSHHIKSVTVMVQNISRVRYNSAEANNLSTQTQLRTR